MEQAWQSPEAPPPQAEVQQTPSTQNPLPQVEPLPHAAPIPLRQVAVEL